MSNYLSRWPGARVEDAVGIDFEPLSAQSWEDPYPAYRQLRDEAPAHRSAEGVTCVSRHADVVEVLRSPERFRSKGAFDLLTEGRFDHFGPRDAFEMVRFLARARINPLRMRKGPPESLITSDPPRHDALRAIVNRGFTPRRIQAWEARAHEISRECIAKLHRGESFDVVRDLAIPLPMTIIAEMIGIPPSDRACFKRWSDEMVAGVSGSQRKDSMATFFRTLGELHGYLRGVVRERRSAPRDDLISVLVDPAQSTTLDTAGVVQFVTLLLIAGNETTTNLIGNAVLALLDHPEELDRVQSDLSLVPNLVEETLRWNTPVQLVLREATAGVTLHGREIPEGERVAVLLASANRDERVFDDADRFDVTRDTRGHVGFGFGVHFCLGASLARLEAKAALEALVPELPRLRRRDSETPLVDSYLVRGPARLELEPAETGAQ